MADRVALHRWMLRGAYVATALLVLFVQLLPLNTTAARWAGPDLVLALTFGFAVRRPEFLPALAVAGVMLLADLLLHRPPGLMALLVLVGTEALKARSRGLRDQNFAVEWMTVGAALLAIVVVQRVVLAVLMVPQAPLGLTLMQAVATLAAYPVVVLTAHLVLGLTKAHPAEIDTERRRT